jgi:hypothetical protein
MPPIIEGLLGDRQRQQEAKIKAIVERNRLYDRLRAVYRNSHVEVEFDERKRLAREYSEDDDGENQNKWLPVEEFLAKYEVPFVPEPEKEVTITEDDEMPVNYDIDDDAEKADLPENKSFYDNTKGKLDTVAGIYQALATELLPFLQKDKFFMENKIDTLDWTEKFLIHSLWGYYRKEGNNSFNSIETVKAHMIGAQKYTLSSMSQANTYIYKSMDEIVKITQTAFESILALGDVKLNAKSNKVTITVNGETYEGVLNPNRKKGLSSSDNALLYYSDNGLDFATARTFARTITLDEFTNLGMLGGF